MIPARKGIIMTKDEKKPDVVVTSAQYPSILDKLVRHRVVTDFQPYCKGPALYYELTLEKDGEWWCEYLGFLDLDELAQIESLYQVTVTKVTTLDEIGKAIAAGGESK
jgi:hypothetical protein